MWIPHICIYSSKNLKCHIHVHVRALHSCFMHFFTFEFNVHFSSYQNIDLELFEKMANHPFKNHCYFDRTLQQSNGWYDFIQVALQISCTWKNVNFPARTFKFPAILACKFPSQCQISLQKCKFPGKEHAKLPIFSHHERVIQTLPIILFNTFLKFKKTLF